LKLYPSRAGKKAWLFLILPSWLALSILLGIGPVLQQTIGGVLSDPAPSLYGAVFGEGLIRAISFLEWLTFGFDPPLLVAAFITTVVAFSGKTRFEGAVRAGFCALITITVSDAAIAIFSDQEVDLGQSLVFNAIGAAFVAMLFLLAFTAISTISRSGIKIKEVSYLYTFTVIISALVTTFFTYTLFNLFFHPSSSTEFLVEANFPTSGYTVAGGDLSDGIERPRKPISAFPQDNKAESFDFTGFANKTAVEWKRREETVSFDVALYILADCLWVRDLDDLKVGVPTFQDKIDSLDIEISEGHAQLLTDHVGTRTYNLTSPSVTQFWFKADDKGKMNGVQAFVSMGETVSVNPDSGMRIYLGGPLINVEEDRSEPQERAITIALGNTRYKVSAGGEYDENRSRGKCSQVKGFEIEQSGGENSILVRNAKNLLQLGVLVKISRATPDDGIYQVNESLLTFKNLNGWAEIHDLHTDLMRDSHLGTGRGLSIHENLRRLVIDGKPVEVTPTDKLTAVSDLNLGFEDTYLRASGTATAIWLNNRRLNTTTWERLAEGWQIAIVTGLLGLIGLIFSKLYAFLPELFRKEQPIDLDVFDL
jgi:hypothetical protein